MKKIKIWSLGAAVFGTLLILGGCTLSLGSTASGGNKADGGVWKTTDGGKTWNQAAAVPSLTGKPKSIANVNVRRLAIDPQDSGAIYLATQDFGILYSYDGGSSWQQFKQLNKGVIRAVAVDPKSKCTIYALGDNKLFKTIDCGRTWQNPYYHQNAQVILTDLAISHQNPEVVYVSTSEGETLKSSDGGQTWVASYWVKNDTIADLLIDSDDANIVYIAAAKKGLYKTVDGGKTWNSLGEGLKSYTGSHEYRGLALDQATKGSLFLISKFGMLHSVNGGQTWEIVNLLPNLKSTLIYALAVNPKNSQEIFYVTLSTLVKSTDGGKTWSSQKLPFSRQVSEIVIDPEEPQNVYLATIKME